MSINSKLAKKYGQPHNASTCTGGAASNKTDAASRPTVNGNISKGKFLPDARAGKYGVKGV